MPEKLPFLESIGWSIANVYDMTEREMLQLYERNWSYLSLFNNLEEEEKDFILQLANKYQSWLISELC